MEPVVFTTKDNKEITIRQAAVKDAAAMITFCNELFASTDQVLTTTKEFNPTVEQEEAFIRDYEKYPNDLLLVAMHNDKVVGLLNFNCGRRIKTQHEGEFGISTHPQYQNNGIGKALLTSLLGWAKTKPVVRKISLHVLTTNSHAIHMYESIGFKEEGRKLKSVKQPDGSYGDLIYMGHFL
jgi:ribosomal protein S18 acetylase RimI-like enzyme